MGSAVNAPTSSANAWLRRSRRRWTQSRALCCHRRGPPRKLARPPLGSGRRPRTLGVSDLRRAGPEGEGYAASHRATISAGSGHAPTPNVPRTTAHPGTTTGSLTLRGIGRVPGRPSWWRLPAGVVDDLGHAVRSATHHPVAIPVLGCDTPVSPPTAASSTTVLGSTRMLRRRSWVGHKVLSCRARVDERLPHGR